MKFDKITIGLSFVLITALMLVTMIGQATEAEPANLLVKGYIRPSICADYLGFSSHRWPVAVQLLQGDVPLQMAEGKADESGLFKFTLDSIPSEDQLRVEITVQGDWSHPTYHGEIAVEGPELDFGRIYMQKRF